MSDVFDLDKLFNDYEEKKEKKTYKKPADDSKRKATALENLKKGREKLNALRQKKQAKKNKIKVDDSDDESDSSSSEDSYYEKKHKKQHKKHRGSSRKSDADDRLDRIEKMVYGLVSYKRKKHTKPKVEKNITVQIPQPQAPVAPQPAQPNHAQQSLIKSILLDL